MSTLKQILLAGLCLQCTYVGAQSVGIGTSTPNAAAILHLNSSNKGFLLPSLILTGSSDNVTIPSPPPGLMVWHNDKSSIQGLGVYVNAGNAASPNWRKLRTSDDSWITSGNSGADGAKLGHLDYRPLQFIVNNQHIGRLGGNRNILFGLNSGNNLPIPDAISSSANVIIGNDAFSAASIGYSNVAIGNGSMGLATGGNFGLAIGNSTLYYQEAGAEYNIALGQISQFFTTTGSLNLSIGANSLYSNSANSRSTAIGHFALRNADNRDVGRYTFNTAIGYAALRGSSTPSLNTGQWNTAVGDSALGSLASGNGNTSIGTFALLNNTSGNNNIALGYKSLMDLTEGSRNIAIGNNTGSAANSQDNIGIGDSTLFMNLGGQGNIAIGISANRFGGVSGSLNDHNVAIGFNSLINGGAHNVVIGSFAKFRGKGYQNVAIGDSAMYNTGLGDNNTIVGSSAFKGSSNLVNTGSYNAVLGYRSGINSSSASKNTLLGAESGFNLGAAEGTVMIGYNSGYFEATSNKLYIENSDAGKDNALIYGDFAADSLLLNSKTINRNLFAVRGAGANTGIEIGYGVFLKDPTAGRIGYGLATANTIDFYGGGTSASTRAIKFWAEGGSNFTGPVNVDGFTRLGTVADAAPKVKMKKLSVTGPVVSAFTSYATGITDAKILAVNIMMTYSSTWKMPPNYTDSPGYEYNYQVQNGNVVIINKSGNSANIGSKPITILITYEE